MTQDELLAYIAGLFDGEGTIYVLEKDYSKGQKGRLSDWNASRARKNHHAPKTYELFVGVTMKEAPAINLLQEAFPGYVRLTKRGYWTWTRSARKARQFLEQILPWLLLKKERAKLALLVNGSTPQREKAKLREQISSMNLPKGGHHKFRTSTIH